MKAEGLAGEKVIAHLQCKKSLANKFEKVSEKDMSFHQHDHH